MARSQAAEGPRHDAQCALRAVQFNERLRERAANARMAASK